MAKDVGAILELEVPVIVLLGERGMKMADVVGLAPGAIIELPKMADEELELLVNNKRIGSGSAVKVGENFGIQISYIGDLRDRILALGAEEPDEPAALDLGVGGDEAGPVEPGPGETGTPDEAGGA